MNSIVDIAENLSREIEGKLREIDQLKLRSLELDNQESRLFDKTTKLDLREKELLTQADNINKEKEYVARGLERIKQQELLDKKLEEKKTHLKLQEEKNIREKARLDEKAIELNKLNDKEQELLKREEIIRKAQEAIAVQRESLDFREKANAREMQRLQDIAASFSR